MNNSKTSQTPEWFIRAQQWNIHKPNFWENSFWCHFEKSSLRAAVLPEDNVESIIIIPYARKQTKNHFPQPDFVLHFVAFSCMWVFNIVEITFIFAASAISAIEHLLNSWGLENGKAHQPWGLRVAPAHKGCFAIFFPIYFICNTKYECNYNHNLSQIIETWRKVFRKLSIAFNILTHFVGLAQLGMENSFTF